MSTKLTLEERVDRLDTEVEELREVADQVAQRADTTDSRNRRALALLADLLSTPDQRPESWEAPHVEALEDRLSPVFDALTGADA